MEGLSSVSAIQSKDRGNVSCRGWHGCRCSAAIRFLVAITVLIAVSIGRVRLLSMRRDAYRPISAK